MSPEEYQVAVVRLTAPGKLEEEPEVHSEWRGVARVKPEPVFEQEPTYFLGPITYFPTSYLAGITLHLDLSNTSIMRLDQRTTLNEPVGLELWAPMTAGGEAETLDPLEPRRDWDTATGTWARSRYYSGYVVQYAHRSFIKEMAVNIGRGPGLNELYQVEVLER